MNKNPNKESKEDRIEDSLNLTNLVWILGDRDGMGRV